MQSQKKIKVFLSSSDELISDRNLFELMIERKNKLWSQTNGLYIDLQKWEILSEAVSPTRKQDDYNIELKNADILIILFWTKAGKYTLEEYQLAKKMFIETGKPNIIIYKKFSTYIEDNLKEFFKYLNEPEKEHFYSSYKVFPQLESKFLNEIDLYINKYKISTLTLQQENRIELLNGLEIRYVRRFNKRMQGEINFHLELRLEYTKEGTTDEFINDYYIENYEINSVEAVTELLYDFESKLKRILILGDPGSGKTVLLLFFALKLIKKAKVDFEYPVPIILNLATWRKEYKLFETWLEDNLVFAAGEYGASKKHAKELSKENLLLLLDGFDEIPENDRSSCMEILSEYFKKQENSNSQYAKYPQGIISSRKAEYLNLNKKAIVRAGLSISAIEPIHLTNELKLIKSSNSSAKILLNRINEFPNLLGELNTVFKVHLALSASSILNFDNFSTEYLLKKYSENELNKISGFKKDESIKYLQFLSFQLKNKKKTITFELVDVQPDWISNPYYYYYLFSILYSGLASLFWSSILYTLYPHAKYGFFTFFPFITGVFLLVEVFTIKKKKVISPKEIRVVDFKDFNFRKFFMELLISSKIWLWVCCAIDFIIVFYVFYSKIIFKVYYHSYSGHVLKFILTFIYYTIGFQLLFILLPKAIFKLFRERIKVKRFPNIKNAYQRLSRPAIFIFVKLLTVSSLLFINLIYTLFYNDPDNLSFEFKFAIILFLVLIDSIICAFFAIISSPLFKHLVLRLLLFFERKTPLRFRTFLNKVSDTGLMEKDGGQWRFRHQLIQDYFANYFK